MLKNGKSLKEALEQLSEYKEKTALKNDKYSYYKVEEYYERMVSVLGKDGFECSYEYEKTFMLGTKQCFMVASCRIDILDEDGKSCYFTNGLGSIEIEYSEKNGRFILVNNVGFNCQIAAFKSACRQLNIFNCLEKEDNIGSQEADGNHMNSQNAYHGGMANRTGAENKGGIQKKSFYVTKGLQQKRIDKNSGKPVYVMYVHDIKDGMYEVNEKELLFYPNQYAKYGEKWNQFFVAETVGVERTVSLFCSTVNGNDNTYVFKGF